MIQFLRCSTLKKIKVCFPPVNRFLKDIPFYSIQVAITDDSNFLSKLGCFHNMFSYPVLYVLSSVYGKFFILVFIFIKFFKILHIGCQQCQALVVCCVWLTAFSVSFYQVYDQMKVTLTFPHDQVSFCPAILQWEEFQMNSLMKFWDPVDDSV